MINEESVITAGERNVGRALLLKHDPNMDEATKQQQWADVTSFMLADEFDDEKQKILETYKQDNFEGRPVSKKIFTGRKMAQLMGVKDMPVMYFKNQGLAVPENAKEDKDLFMAIYDNELPKMREAKIGQQKREAEIFAKQQQIERASVEYVQGKGFAKLADLVEFSDNPEEGIKTLERANKAFKVIEQVALDDDGKWGSLDNFSRNDAVRLNTILGGDEYAFGLLTEALNNEAEAQGLDSVEFFGGIKRGLNKLAMNAGDYLANKSMIGGDMVDVGSGTMVDANSSPDVMEAFLDLFRSDKKASQKPADFTQDDARQIDSLMGLMSNYEEQMTKTKKDAAWWVKGLNGAGRMVGDSAIYMMPHTGVQMAVVNELGKATNQSALLNEGPLGIFKNASRNILEEKAFGVFSVFGKFGTINAALKKLNNSKLVNLAAKAPVRSFVEGTKTGKAMFAIGGEWAEEMVMENLVGMTYEQAAGRIFKLLDNSVQVEKFEPLKQIWESIKDPEESLGCALFVGMMTSSRFGSLKKEVAQYVSSVDRARAAGFTKSHAQELAGIKDIEKRADRAQELFNMDVLGDIEGATKRAQEAGRELIEKEEAQWHQASGVVEKALTDRGIAKIETMPGGEKCLITMEEKDGEEAQTKELTVDQTASLIRVAISDAKLEGIRSMQSRLMGDALSESADRTQYMDVLDMYGESAPQEYQRDAKNKAGITLKGMQSLAERAKARIDYIMNEESISYDEAAVKSDGSVMNGVALGSVAQLGSAMEKRLDIAVKSGEITRKQADLMKEGYVPVSEVHRMGKAGDPASSIVMVARGEASAENILEDVHESALVNMVAQGKTTWEKLWDGLKGMETELKAYGVHLGLTDGKPSQMDVIEAFSKLSLADFIANVDDMNISQNAKNLVNYSIRQLESGAYLTQVADAYSEYESSLEEPQDGDLAEMLKAVGLETQSLFNSMKFNAEVNQAKIQLWMDRAAERQANHDGRLSADEQGVVLEEAEAQDKLEEEIEQGRDESVEPDPSPIIMDHQGEVMAIGDNALVDDKRGKGLVGGRFIEGNGFIVGYVETSALSLAPDVEQFKEGEKSKFGAIKGKELSGEFDPNTDPISVWRRIDGSLQVITGRHRYDLAKRNGVEAMQARVYEENDVYNVQWAKLHDIRKNIMDNQATPLEVAFFVRNSGISKADMKAQGLLRGGSSAVLGYDIAILACDEVFTRLKNGDITAQQAFNIVHASNTEKGQTIALKLIKEGKPLEYVNSYCREADRIISEDSLNLFGDDESWIKDCEKVADYVSKSVALINARLGILNKSNGLKRNIKSAEKMGITLETPDDIKSRIEELEMLKIEYQRHDSRLRIHQSAMEWDGKSELDPFEYIERIGEEVNPDQMGFSFSIKSVNIEADDVVSSASEMRAKLKPLQGKVFVNKNTGLQAVIEARVSGKTVSKAQQAQMSVANLKALGYSPDEARKIHYTAATRIHELFENAPDAFFEESYKGDSARAGAYHLFNTVEIEGVGRFDVNVSALELKREDQKLLYTLELTIENPEGVSVAYPNVEKQQDAYSTSGVSNRKLASYLSFVEKEMREIKTKAQDDGTYLKAPNGEETKLNEKQWLQVRTKAFKEWFGDWENDAENASKVVDENGEPMVVYHGTQSDFTTFDKKLTEPDGDLGASFYFTNSIGDVNRNYVGGGPDYDYKIKKQIERGIAKTEDINKEIAIKLDVFLNIRNPVRIGKNETELFRGDILFDNIDEKIELAVKSTGLIEGQLDTIKSIFNEALDEGISYEVLRGCYDYLTLEDKEGREITSDVIRAIFQTIGYDGIIDSSVSRKFDMGLRNNTIHFAVFSPNQIKSATNNRGTFDGENPDITFSVKSPQAQSLFSEGVLKASNCIITDPSFSIYASHASPMAGIREFSTDHIGKGEGNQAYGWGLYFSTNDKVNEYYMNQFLTHRGQANNYAVELKVLDKDIVDWYDIVTPSLRERLMASNDEVLSNTAKYLEDDATFETFYNMAAENYMDAFDGTEEDENGLLIMPEVVDFYKQVSVALLDLGIKGIRYADAFTRGKTIRETYNYVIFDGKDVELIAYDKNGEWFDPSFSLSGGKSIWDAAYMAELDNRIDNLNKTIRKSIEQWNVVCSNKRAKTSDLAKAYGEAMARVSAVYKVLPEGFRFAMHPYMNAVKNHMEKMEGAKGTLSKEELGEKAQDAMESLLKRTQDQLRKYTKARMMRDLNDALKRVKPKKNKSGKLKGKMDAEHYRRLSDVERMMNASSEEKQNRLDELQGLIENLTDEDTKEADAYKVELMDWAVFGCWKDMGIDKARGAFNAAMDFIMEGRLKWEEKLKVNKLKNKRKAEIIVDSLGVPDKNEQAAAPGKTVGMMSAVKTAMTYGMKSYAQTLDAIGAKSDEMRVMMDAEIVAISEANVRLGMMKNQREREVDELIARVTGIKSATKRKKWLIGFKKAHETGIDLYPKGWKTKQLTIDDARRLVNMTKDQREAERKKITKDYHKQGMSSRDAIVDEVAIPYFEEKINELDGLPSVPKNRKYLTVRYEVNTNEVTKNLKVSKAQAMYTILLSEQKEYAENLESDGVNQDVLNQLREYVGEDGIQFGYGLREIMNRQGDLLAEVYESREGVPFPRVENYFRATFKITHKQNEGKSLETNSMGNGGAKYGMLIARRKHNLDLAWDTDCVSVFKASSAEVDNYIVSGDITSRWRGILSDRQAAKSIESRVGVNGLKSLKEWANIIEGAGAIQGNIELAHSQTVSRLQGAKAVALLAYNLPTLLKQVSALRHGYYAGDVSWARFLVHLSGAMIGQGRMNAKQMMKRDAFKARQEYDRALDEIMGYAEGQNYSAVANFAMCGMGCIEKMDVWSNAVTMTALYNAKWADMEKINEGSDIKMSEEEMDGLCMQAVQSALELGAQPLTATQKSLMGNNNTAGSKVLCFMGSEVVNKYGLVLDLIEKGNWGKAAMMVIELSLIEQSIMMMYNYLLDDEEEWEKRGGFEGYAIGAPMAFLGGIPALGSSIEAIYNRMTGQRIYIGTSSAVFDVGSFFTSWKKTYEAIMGKRDKRGRLIRRNLSTEDWFNIISNDIRTAAFGFGAFRGSQSKLADGIASWILSAAASMNLAKPGVKLADKYGE